MAINYHLTCLTVQLELLFCLSIVFNHVKLAQTSHRLKSASQAIARLSKRHKFSAQKVAKPYRCTPAARLQISAYCSSTERANHLRRSSCRSVNKRSSAVLIRPTQTETLPQLCDVIVATQATCAEINCSQVTSRQGVGKKLRNEFKFTEGQQKKNISVIKN